MTRTRLGLAAPEVVALANTDPARHATTFHIKALHAEPADLPADAGDGTYRQSGSRFVMRRGGVITRADTHAPLERQRPLHVLEPLDTDTRPLNGRQRRSSRASSHLDRQDAKMGPAWR